jgi:4-hydroxy-tetrahydrodipicolinate synthase
MTLPLLALGGKGLISVASNEIPAEMTELVRRGLQGDFAGARTIHHKYLALMDINFVESNPIPVKAAMAMMGLCQPVWRLPLVPPSEAAKNKIQTVLEHHGLLTHSAVAS